MEGQAEGLACADPVARTPIGVSGINVTSLVCQVEFQDSLSFSNIFHTTIVFYALYDIDTVGSFKVEALVYFPLTFIHSNGFQCSSCHISPYLFVVYLNIVLDFGYFSSYNVVSNVSLPP